MTLVENNNKQMMNNTVLLSIRMVFVLIISLYTSRLVLNALGVEDYGVYNVISGFVSMFAFLNASLANGIQRFFNYEIGRSGQESISKVFSAAMTIQISLSIVVLVLLETVGLWYLKYKMVIPEESMNNAFWLFHFSGLSLVLVIIQIPYSAALMAFEKMQYFALISVLDAVLKLCSAIILFFLTRNQLLIYGLLLFVIGVVDFFCYYVCACKKIPYLLFNRRIDFNLLKNMLSFSGWNVFGTFAMMTKEQGINLLLNLFFGPVINAARGIAYQVSSAVQSFVANIGISIRPQLVQSYASGNKSRSFSLMFSMSKFSFVVLYVLSLPLFVDIDFVLRIWLGEVVPDYTSIFVRIVLLTNIVNTLNGAVSAVIHASGKMRKYQIVGAMVCLSILPVSFLFLKMGSSPESVFWIMLLISAIGHIISLYILQLQEGVSFFVYTKEVLLPLSIVMLSSLWVPYIIYYNMTEGFVRLGLMTICSTVVVSLSFYYLGMNSIERGLLQSFLAKKLPFVKKKV